MSQMQWSCGEDRSGSIASYDRLMARSELPKPSIDVQFEVKRTFHYLREYALSVLSDLQRAGKTHKSTSHAFQIARVESGIVGLARLEIT